MQYLNESVAIGGNLVIGAVAGGVLAGYLSPYLSPSGSTSSPKDFVYCALGIVAAGAVVTAVYQVASPFTATSVPTQMALMIGAAGSVTTMLEGARLLCAAGYAL